MFAVVFALMLNAQTALKKVFNKDINPIEQIDQALVRGKSESFFKNWTLKDVKQLLRKRRCWRAQFNLLRHLLK